MKRRMGLVFRTIDIGFDGYTGEICVLLRKDAAIKVELSPFLIEPLTTKKDTWSIVTAVDLN